MRSRYLMQGWVELHPVHAQHGEELCLQWATTRPHHNLQRVARGEGGEQEESKRRARGEAGEQEESKRRRRRARGEQEEKEESRRRRRTRGEQENSKGTARTRP